MLNQQTDTSTITRLPSAPSGTTPDSITQGTLTLDGIRPIERGTAVIAFPGFMAKNREDFVAKANIEVKINYRDENKENLCWNEWTKNFSDALEKLVADNDIQRIIVLADSMAIPITMAASTMAQASERNSRVQIDIIGTRVPYMGDIRTAEKMQQIYQPIIDKLTGNPAKQGIVDLLRIASDPIKSNVSQEIIVQFSGLLVLAFMPNISESTDGTNRSSEIFDALHEQENVYHLFKSKKGMLVVPTFEEACRHAGI